MLPKTMKPERDQNQLLVFVIFVLALVAILFSFGNTELNEQARREEERLGNLQKNLDAVPVLAKAVSVYNISQNKKIYGKNDEVPMPIASLAKIMTVTVALNNNPKYKMVSISPEAIAEDGDFGLFQDEKWTIEDLAKLTLVVSANDGANALSENGASSFMSTMRVKAQKLGMENTFFLNSTGLDLDENIPGLPAQAGASASARDVNTMAVYGFKAHPEIFSVTTLAEINLKSESGFIHNFKNTDTIVDKIPGLLFSKTGYTELANGNLVIILKNKKGDELAVTVLGSTYEGRFSDMEELVNVLYNQ